VIVADASAMVEVLLQLPATEAVEAYLLDPGTTLHAPHLLDVEVVQVVRRLVAAGKIHSRRGREAIDDLADMKIRRHPHDWLLPRVWELRGNLSAYDAIYVALAEMLDAPLLTRDRRLADAARRYARVEIV
jgi:predicted nucleic acid-binding protein